MTEEPAGMAYEIETALEEVLAHVRIEAAFPCRIVDDPIATIALALRKSQTFGRITLRRPDR